MYRRPDHPHGCIQSWHGRSPTRLGSVLLQIQSFGCHQDSWLLFAHHPPPASGWQLGEDTCNVVPANRKRLTRASVSVQYVAHFVFFPSSMRQRDSTRGEEGVGGGGARGRNYIGTTPTFASSHHHPPETNSAKIEIKSILFSSRSFWETKN